MISIIVCSLSSARYQAFVENVSSNIGCGYEIIRIDNRDKNHGLSRVYNAAALDAKYDIICLIHEDTRIHGHNWGKIICEAFENINVGGVGVCGAIYRPKIPAPWPAVPKSFYRSTVIQHWNNGTIFRSNNREGSRFSEVAVLDGVCLATRKSLCPVFDEATFPGFHFYDMDFSMTLGEQHKLLVAHEIELEHFSPGNFSHDWIKSSVDFYNKWKSKLPRSAMRLPNDEKSKAEGLAALSYSHLCLRKKYYSGLFWKALLLSIFSRALKTKDKLDLIKVLTKQLLLQRKQTNE